MPKKIDHEERKEHILKAALEVFAQEGYTNSNLSLIAEKAGISRPTVYQYFHDKTEIYYYAVKLITGRMFVHYSSIAWDESRGDEVDRIHAIFDDIIATAVDNESSLLNLVSVIISAQKEGVDFAEVIHKRTAKLSILFKRLIRQGIDRGTIVSEDIDKASTQLLTIAQMICFQVAFFRAYRKEDSMKQIHDYLETLRA